MKIEEAPPNPNSKSVHAAQSIYKKAAWETKSGKENLARIEKRYADRKDLKKAEHFLRY